MPNLETYWIGNVYGTNTGNLFLEITSSNEGEEVSGTLRINDNVFGLTVYNITGTYENSVLKITGRPISQSNTQLITGELEAEATISEDGSLKGNWKTSLETAGLFVAHPGNPASKTQNSKISTPQPIYIKNISLGALRLSSSDIRQLFKEIKKDLNTNVLIITYSFHGNEKMNFDEGFLDEIDSLKNLNNLKIYISEPAENNLNKMISIDLGIFNSNKISVQGPQEAWVIGKAEKLALFFKSFHSSLITNYKKFGLSINSLLFICMLILTPSIDTLINRAIFVFMVFALLLILQQIHKHFAPIVTIITSTNKLNWFHRFWPAMISWVTTIIGALIVFYITHHFHFFGSY